MSFAELKEEVMKLSPEEKEELARTLDAEDDDWDRQMKADFAAGLFDARLEELDADLAAGRVREMP